VVIKIKNGGKLFSQIKKVKLGIFGKLFFVRLFFLLQNGTCQIRQSKLKFCIAGLSDGRFLESTT
jgi:hypothetical protein